MSTKIKEDSINCIVALENRICKCRRCPSLIKCTRKPSLGKGDLNPEIVLVFECSNNFTKDVSCIIGLHNLIKNTFKLKKIYHTYMVRCQPKACAFRSSISCYTDKKLIDDENRCILSGKQCEGIPVRPDNEEIMLCLPFLLEEIDILNPEYLILFGERVSEFVLRSFGIFDAIKPGNRYEYNNMIVLTTVYEEKFSCEECKQLNILL